MRKKINSEYGDVRIQTAWNVIIVNYADCVVIGESENVWASAVNDAQKNIYSDFQSLQDFGSLNIYDLTFIKVFHIYYLQNLPIQLLLLIL